MKKTVYMIKFITWMNCNRAYKRVYEDDGKFYVKSGGKLFDVTNDRVRFFYCV